MSKKDLKKFNVEMVTKLGGCKPAMKYLRDKFGSQVDDLGNRKADVLDLLNSGKEDWVISFCLNIMDSSSRSKFLEYVLLDLCFEFPTDPDLIKSTKLIIGQFIRGEDNQSDIDAYNSIYQNRLSQLELINNIDEEESKIYARLIKIKKMKAIQSVCSNLNKDFIKACRSSSLNACEAIITRNFMEDSNQMITVMRRNKMKEYALYSMQLTEIWPND